VIKLDIRHPRKKERNKEFSSTVWHSEHVPNSRGKTKMLALGVCFPQPSSSAGRNFHFHKNKFDEMPCNSIQNPH